MRPFRLLPVRIRLTASYVLVLAVTLLVFIAGTSFVLYIQLYRQQARFAIQDVETIEGLLYFEPNGRLNLRQDYFNHPQSRLVLKRLVEVLLPDGEILYRNDRLGQQQLGGPPFRGEGIDGYSERSIRLKNGERVLLVSRVHKMDGKPLIVRLAYSQDEIWSRIGEFLTASLTLLPFILGAVAFLGYEVARRSLLPLEQMALRAEAITADHLHQRLPVENPRDELGHLARVFNSVLDRLERSFEQLRRFTSDASHELRTPLAAIRSVGEVGLQSNRTPVDYQDTIGSMLEEVNRLTTLVESLLTISRADAGQLQLHIETFPLMDLVREVAGIMQVLAEEREQRLIVMGDEEASVCGDRLLLRQVLVNVLDNAVKFSPIRGEIVAAVGTGSGRVCVRVMDSGPGIPREHREKIFQRFYRVDSGRTRGAGGIGLGLSIATWALQVHEGTIRVEEDSERSGAVFLMELPQARGSVHRQC